MRMAEQVIVRRTFKVDGNDAECRFLKPEEDGGDFFCQYEIDWPERTKVHRAGGVDEVQALLLAMKGAHANLLAARNMDGRDVEWLGGLSLGMPIARSIRDWDPQNDM